MNHAITCFWLILALFCFKAHTSTAIQKPTNIDARRYLLYSSTNVSMSNQQFNVTFSNAFTSTPLFVYGINDYKLGDQFYYQNFQSFKSALTQTSFSINVTSVASTNVRTFSISYFAAQQQTSFLSDFKNVTNGANISTVPSSSYRYYQQNVSLTFNSITVYAFPLLTGYYITSSSYFTINITASVYGNNYNFKIETGSDCAILRATFYLLFVQNAIMDANSYYYLGGLDMVQSYNNASSASFTYAVNNYTETVFLLGLRGFGGFTVLSGCYWGWQTPANVTNDTAILTIYENQLLHIYFSFFQIAKYINTTTNSTTNTTTNTTTNSTSNNATNTTNSNSAESGTSSNGTSFLPIIIGIVVGVVITTVVIVVFLRLYWKKTILNVPSNDQFKQMPSLTL